jgi:hypothetical protein
MKQLEHKIILFIVGGAMMFPPLAFSQSVPSKRPSAPVLKKGERQLFVDDFMIQTKQNLARIVHPAQKLEHPVFTAEMPWEVKQTAASSTSA